MTQISAGQKIKGGPTNKDALTNKDRPTTRIEKVRTDHVRQESISVQIPILEKRVASETNDLNGDFRVQVQYRKQQRQQLKPHVR
ncbi:MAG: hypothetical protein WCE53_05055 [Candidatus Acidiferrum sp.]